MVASYDDEEELKTSQDVEHTHRRSATKRAAPEKTDWSAAASQELLRLRFRQLRGLFDGAQTVADVNEAWSVVASKLNDKCKWGLHVDAIKCSDHLLTLRHQWQESSTAQLHLMMAERFGKNADVPQLARNFNQAMEEVLVQFLESTRDHGLQKRCRLMGQTEVVSPPRDLVSPAQADTLSTCEGAKMDDTEWCAGPPLTSSESASSSAHNMEPSGLHEARLLSESALASPNSVFETLQQLALPVTLVEEEELPRQDEIVREMEKRFQQFEKLKYAHQHLASVTYQLMEALDNCRSAARN